MAEVSIDPELEQEMEFGVSHDAGLDSANHQTPMVVGVSQLAASMQRKEEEPSNIAIETAMQQSHAAVAKSIRDMQARRSEGVAEMVQAC